MTSEILFLKPDPGLKPFSNVASGTGGLNFYANKRSDVVLTSAEANSLVNGGVSAAIATAAASYIADAKFSSVFNDSSVFGQGGTYQGEASSSAEILATYQVGSGETLAFNFEAAINLQATEIENSKHYYSLVEQGTKFLVLDVSSNKKMPKIIGHFGIDGALESAQKRLDKSLSKSQNIMLFEDAIASDIDRNNGSDFLKRQVSGKFSKRFDAQSSIAVVKVSSSFTKIAGDGLTDKTVGLVLDGGLGDDRLRAYRQRANVYGSLGNDRIEGDYQKNILEGGGGNDRLWGNGNRDKIHGGSGNDALYGGDDHDILVGGLDQDYLSGGRGNDWLVGVNLTQAEAGNGEVDKLTGNRGYDKFVLGDRKQAYYVGMGDSDYALITDFETGRDRILLHGGSRDYAVEYAKVSGGLVTGSRIYYTGSGQRDLVGLVANRNLEGKLSRSYVFAYNQTVNL